MVKALFPIGKTQWSKWSDDQRTAFNEARAAGVPYGDAVVGANQTQTKKKKSVLDIIEDVAEVAVAVAPVAAVAKTVVKAAVKKVK
jgi:hypothetical protein